MSPPTSAQFIALTERMATWQRPLLLSHIKPDGDALGSLAAMRSMLQSMNCDPRAVLFDPMTTRYALFLRYPPIPVWNAKTGDALLADRDSVIILDACTYQQLEPLAEWLRTTKLPRLAVDHHVTRDDLAGEYLIDESAAATCLILFEWALATDRLSILPHDAREALFVGIATDTGWFRHSNTDERALRAAGELVAAGVRPHELHQQLFLQETPARVRLLGVALQTMQLFAEGRLSVMRLSSPDFQAAGASSADTEDIVNEPLRIGDVVVSVLLVEQGDGSVRVNFRSKPPLTRGDRDLDVAAIAASFSGGGHARAAGARLPGPFSAACEKIIARLKIELA